MRYDALPPIFQHLVQQSFVISDPGCFQRRCTQPSKPGWERERAGWVWIVNWEQWLVKKGVVTVTKENGAKERPEFRGFINIALHEEHKADLQNNPQTIKDVLENVAALLFEGYKLALSYDKGSGAAQAVLTCWVEGHNDFGYAISARHPDLDRAIETLLYKHFSITGEQWSAFNPPAPLQKWD